jgi:DNA-directed RNA polymerase beta subunit
MTQKLGIKTKYEDEGGKFLQLSDLITALKYYLNLREGKKGFEVDDIDHLANRRIRSV